MKRQQIEEALKLADDVKVLFVSLRHRIGEFYALGGRIKEENQNYDRPVVRYLFDHISDLPIDKVIDFSIGLDDEAPGSP